MGDTGDGSWNSRQLGGYIRREESRREWERTHPYPLPPDVDPLQAAIERAYGNERRQAIRAEQQRIVGDFIAGGRTDDEKVEALFRWLGERDKMADERQDALRLAELERRSGCGEE